MGLMSEQGCVHMLWAGGQGAGGGKGNGEWYLGIESVLRWYWVRDGIVQEKS